ncbi:HesA/MoeB/ThiF family protein [Acidaminobacter sp. JC074]|uniref:HesA/MoeB/ThiF family protein n=1 Tax=Acidaminobacter sp. JC074 TaxID=2530199 RepID=UPI001F0F30C5|nr:HesA/MoeB/ThiF family protein [Acidaminobacter sp. JC074]MCH4889397.1 HesA/MoeB/ThiF family protein [Acidaminobacter sp. JC074]
MRYSKNMNMLSEEENKSLRNFKVAVIGCGGLGGFIAEMLARLGIGNLICIDGDVFDESNLNRQLLSRESNLGKHKALIAHEHLSGVNSTIDISYKIEMLHEENAEETLMGYDLVFDAVDDIEVKLMLQGVCEKLEIPLIHGAIGGWYGQVSTILPGDRTLDKIYRGATGIESLLGNPSFTPATIASIQVAEGLKVLLGKGDILSKKVLHIDLLEHEYEVIEF